MKRVRRPSAAAVGAAATVAVAEAAAVEIAAGAVAAVVAEIAATGAIEATAAIAGRLTFLVEVSRAASGALPKCSRPFVFEDPSGKFTALRNFFWLSRK